MNQDNAIMALLILQVVGFTILFTEKENFRKNAVKVNIGRVFMLLLPLLTLMSILIRPLEG